MSQCTATTQKGTRCTRNATQGKVCPLHVEGAKVGRPSLLPEVREDFLKYLRAGATIKDACGIVGIHVATYYGWLERGEADVEAGVESDYSEFFEASTHARAYARASAVAHIRTAMSDDWRAAAWYLERSDSENWGRQEKVEHSGELRQRVRVELDKLTDNELADLERIAGKLES